VVAASMAKLGFTGADTIFEGERGFLHAFAGRDEAATLVSGLGRPYALEIEFKPYSCARPIHNAIDCALEIRRAHAPALAKIRSIVVRRHPDWSEYHRNPAPRTYHEAQVSLPYSIAIALLEGNALLDQYTDRKLANAAVRRLMGLTRIETDPKLPRGVSCHTTMTMASGEAYVSQVDFPKGSVQNPMSDDELRAKFESLSVPVVGRVRAARIADTVAAIEKCPDVGQLMRLTVARAR
jgi:2-methylcitrate dehydratase PrpD